MESSKERSTKSMKRKSNEKINVTIDLGLSAYANATEYFNIKKTSAQKQKKVEKNVGKAMTVSYTHLDVYKRQAFFLFTFN